ncbi:ADP-ribose pyrophosphatase, mitochondrial-like [Saccostrea echinata]|uniref:ADP-ribose pyrophosphatase, mitochondrial-like n=1 Tax=Saccostrea echinata TaxID=191078 RepID=UPI002A81807B|nr:ADP-ribose pyrophosphatase, mitochondrial-like [Saccostrea echinata]XP_061197851.1 ADP-ribose pyrophosphatase, mitochondrial-like [Saccostrea echinata]
MLQLVILFVSSIEEATFGNRGFMGNKATSVARFSSAMKPKCHIKARCEIYPRSEVKRFPVPDEKVPWTVSFPDYKPVDYTAPSILKRPVYADPDIRNEKVDPPLNFNGCDGKINRVSHMGKYEVINGVPRNPRGRTGVIGRGQLGRWGPNHAADPIVTRWKRDDSGKAIQGPDSKPVLQFVSVQRRDNHQWAIPGGMVDAGEVVTATVRREFGEEALNSMEMSPAEKQRVEKELDELFSTGREVYRGYVDDPRNTDNAWMETVAMNFHDEDSSCLGKIQLCAGDDAMNVQWMDLSGKLDLYASHIEFLAEVANSHNASW